MKPKLTLLMPVRNEGVNLRMMLNIMKSVITVPHEVLVVHDTPDDDSIPVAREMKRSYRQMRLVHNQLGRGVSNAVRAGVKEAKGKYVLITVADDIGPLFAIDDMVSLMDRGCDFVSATRYARGGKVHGGAFTGRLLSRTANKLFYHLAGASLTDSTVGFKMFRTRSFESLGLEGKPIGWLVTFEMAINAQLQGMKMGEVPITSINRFYGGESTFRLGAWTRAYFKLFLRGWKQLIGKERNLLKQEKEEGV